MGVASYLDVGCAKTAKMLLGWLTGGSTCCRGFKSAMVASFACIAIIGFRLAL